MYQLINVAVDYLNRRSPILVQTPWQRRFGNAAEEIFYGLLWARREKKRVLFLYPRYGLLRKVGVPVTNKELFRLRSDYSMANEPNNAFGLLAGWLLATTFIFLRAFHSAWCSPTLRGFVRGFWPKISRAGHWDRGYVIPTIGRALLWKPEAANSFSWAMVEGLNWKKQYDEYSPPALEDSKFQRAQETRVQMGIPLTDWFVCVHIREHPWGKVRNSSIQNHIPAMEAITAAGGWVVRIGDTTMTPLPRMERVIDYPHAPYKSELMDLYLISQCRFFVGTNSGPSDVATLFQKPMVLVNMTEWAIGLPMKKGDLALIRHIFSRSRNRFLSIEEVLNELLRVPEITVLSDNYVAVENTADEIREVVEEFLRKREPFEYSELQEMFNEGRRMQIQRWLANGAPDWHGFSSRNRLVEQYRIASRCHTAAGTLGQKFLERNWVVDDLEGSGPHPPRMLAVSAQPS